jgi:predicted metalloprotease with PDZ domain
MVIDRYVMTWSPVNAIFRATALALFLAPILVHAENPPAVEVTLTPRSSAGVINRLEIGMRIEKPAIAAGQTLLRMPTKIVSIPTASYDASAIEASDTQGPLRLQQVDEAATPTGVYRHWSVDRATVGDVAVRYGTGPRVVNSTTRNGPLFDLRAEGGGLLGAGVYFLALPVSEVPHRIALKWDLSQVPEGTRGVSSFGEGNQDTVSPLETLAFSFYMVGPIKSQPADGKGNFGFYWLAQPPFDVAQIADGIFKLYGYMSKFFHDEGGHYRVFVRGNPYPAGGGTALNNSFMFGYGSDGTTIAEGPQMLIAHEMAHNWPKLNGAVEEDHASTAWYTEGTAEYYSALLSERAGAISNDKFLNVINEHAENYYTNPYLTLTNKQAGEKFWSDGHAQRVPYGRGFMYLARVDAQMRRKSGGKRSVDDLVLQILEEQKAGKKIGLNEWRGLVVKELGEDAGREYDEMTVGKPMEPAATSFGPCFHPLQEQVKPFELGYDGMQPGLVKNLISDSAAAKAGVQEGDVVLSFTPLDLVRNDPNKTMDLKLRRGDRELEVNYLPRKEAVPAWHWVRDAAVSDAACKF